MADANTFYVNPSTVISQVTRATVSTVAPTASVNVTNLGGSTVVDTGMAVPDAAGNTPTIVDPVTGDTIVNPLWTATYNDAVFHGGSTHVALDNESTNATPGSILFTLGLKQYEVVSVDEDEYAELERLSVVDETKLYLIRETI